MKSTIQALKAKIQNGVSPAMATPLLEDGTTVNTAVIPQLVQFLIDAGAKGLFVAGTTGEGILLTLKERMKLAEAAMAAANGRVPVMLHVGANRMDWAILLAQHAATLNCQAIAAVTPYYYGVHDDALLTYYQTISEAAPDTPLLLYDIPHMAINHITPERLPTFFQNVPTLAGIKSSLKDAQIIRQQLMQLDDAQIMLVGNEAVALGSLAMGADGLISGLSTAVPEPFVALTQAFAAGDLVSARRWHQCIGQLLAEIPAGTRIGTIKTVLAERGIAVGTAVPPRPMPRTAIWPRMKSILDKAATR